MSSCITTPAWDCTERQKPGFANAILIFLKTRRRNTSDFFHRGGSALGWLFLLTRSIDLYASVIQLFTQAFPRGLA